jgi:glycosyltransferase involved in cell wall biosynthesis
LVVADGVAATVEAVAKWFADPEVARRDGLAAAKWVRQEWRWERMYGRLDAILAELNVPFE